MISSLTQLVRRAGIARGFGRIAGVLVVVCALPVSSHAQTPLTEDEAVARLAEYAGVLRGDARASFPASMSSSGDPLDSMGPVPVGKACFAAWRKTFQAWVEKGYLSGFREEEHTMSLYTEHLTSAGAQYFGPVLPVRFHSSVRTMPPLAGADIQVTEITPGDRKKDAVAVFRCPPSEPFSIMWANKVITQQCRGIMDTSLILDNGDILAHAHFRYRGKKKGWQAVNVVLGECQKGE